MRPPTSSAARWTPPLSSYDDVDLDGYDEFLAADEIPRLRGRHELGSPSNQGDLAAVARRLAEMARDEASPPHFLAVGSGQRPPEWPASLLASTGRSSAVSVAPQYGLTLAEVGYPTDEQLAARAETTRRRRVTPW